MMLELIRILIAEFIVLTMICEGSGQTTVVCAVTVARNLKKADCMYRKGIKPTINGFPNNLLQKATELKILDISGNIFQRAEFVRLSQLTHLFAKNLEFVDLASKGGLKTGLSKLRQLQELDLSGTKFDDFYNLTGILWPKELTKLTLSNMSLIDVGNLRALLHLEQLDLNHNNLQSLPKLNASAGSLILIDLKHNPIINIDLMQIAPFCELQTFLLDVASPGNFNSPDNFKNCSLIENWLIEFEINKEQFSCNRNSSGGDDSKSVSFPSEAMNARNVCLSALPATSIFELLLYAISFTVLFPLLYFGNEAYNNYIVKKNMPPPMPVKRRRRKRRTVTTAGPEIDVEIRFKEETHAPEAQKNSEIT